MSEQVVVLVDDDEEYRESLAAGLRACGYETLQFDEAQRAWESVAEGEPTMIIAELALPDAHGISLLRAYRRAFPQRRTPFVFLSYDHDPDQIVRSLEAGADDHWSKVHRVEELIARVGVTLRRHRPAPPPWQRESPAPG